MASGMALLRSQFLDAPVVQVAIWDGGPSGGPGGCQLIEGAPAAKGASSTSTTSPGWQV